MKIDPIYQLAEELRDTWFLETSDRGWGDEELGNWVRKIWWPKVQRCLD